MMDLEQFWELIEQARRKIDASRGPEGYPRIEDEVALADVLRTLSPAEIVQFDHRFWERVIYAYHWDLWAALHVIDCGGEDTFEHFRAELILMGRRVYEAAVKDADSLADACPLPVGFEGLIYVASKVYKERTGQDFPSHEDGDIPPYPSRPAGVPWEEIDLPTRLPRLWAAFNE